MSDIFSMSDGHGGEIGNIADAPLSEMVERVARAIAAADGYYNWVTAHERTIAKYTGLARAAIDAMRTPTIEMCRDAAWDDYGPDECQTCWQAMIDAALK